MVDRLQVFISYALVDSDYARELTAFLATQDIAVVTRPSHEMSDNDGSAYTQMIDESSAVVLVVTDSFSASRRSRAEFDYAAHVGVRVLPLLLRGDPPEYLRAVGYEDLRGRPAPAEAVVHLVRALRPVPAHPRGDEGRVFLSHTSELASYPPGGSFVQAALDAVARAGRVAVDMRYFTARDSAPADYCRRRVRECQVYVAIIGLRYGSLVPDTTVSYTELEFETATKIGIPRFIFQLNEGSELPEYLWDADSSSIRAFRARLRNAGLTISSFSTLAELELRVYQALRELAEEQRTTSDTTYPGSTAISARRLLELMAQSLPAVAHEDLAQYVQGAAQDPSRTVIVEETGDLVGEGDGHIVVKESALRQALALAGRSGPRVPLQLPIDIPDFTNRAHEMETLESLLVDTPGVVCVYGMGGVGKSSLVAHFAHTRQDAFPDGTLWADLRHQGTASVLDMFAFSFGADLSTVKDTAAKSNVLRSLLETRRLCMVLDNAEHASNLEPLLGFSQSASTIVTTRNADTPELRGYPQLRVDSFTEESALQLFARVLGPDVETSQRETAARLAAALGYLPLAIDIGARLSQRAMVGIDALADALEESSPTEMLTDGSRSLHACFALSWDNLKAVQRRALMSMALIDAPSYDSAALAVMNELSKSHLQYLMGDLVARSLVAFTQSGRYSLHPMVGDFVSGRLAIGDPRETMAAGRLAASFYLDVVEYDSSRPASDRDEAWHRTRTEFENIVSAWKWCGAHGEPELVKRYALSLGPYLMQRGYWRLGATLLEDGVTAAARVADATSDLRLRLLRGELAREQGSYESAALDIQRCLDAAPSMGREFEARAVRQLAELRRVERRYRESLRLHRISLAMSIEINDMEGQMRSLHDCGLVERIVGEFDAAAAHFQDSVRMADLLGAAAQRAYTWLEMGIVARSTGRDEEAAQFLHKAMEFFASNYDLRGQSYTHRELGEVAIARGDLDTALRHHSGSLRLRIELRDRRGEAISRYYLGYAMQCVGRIEEARRMYDLSLAVSEELGDMRNVARIRLRMGEIQHQEGNLQSARHNWAGAVSLFEGLGVAEKELEVAREHLESTLAG